jgi:predicted dehydrogenase
VTKVLNAAVIGLGFGTQFLPIYQRHPNTSMYAVCRRSTESLAVIGDAFGVEKRYTRFQDVLSDPAVDFVHINTPLGTHGALSIAALRAGKHVMCTVPMALSIEECKEIVRLVRVTGLKYMMAETVLYSRESVHSGALQARKTWRPPIPAGLASPGYGRLAGGLARFAAHVLRDTLHLPVFGDRGR